MRNLLINQFHGFLLFTVVQIKHTGNIIAVLGTPLAPGLCNLFERRNYFPVVFDVLLKLSVAGFIHRALLMVELNRFFYFLSSHINRKGGRHAPEINFFLAALDSGVIILPQAPAPAVECHRLDDFSVAGINCDFIFVETDLNRFTGRQFLNDDVAAGFFNKA